MSHAKDTKQGIQERRRILEQVEPEMRGFVDYVLKGTLRRDVAADDVLDASVAFITAEAVVGNLVPMLGEPAKDAKGLPMEMLYLDISQTAQRELPAERGRSKPDLPNKGGVMITREHKVSSRSGRQVMVAGLKLQKDMGYCRGAKVTVTDPTPGSPHPSWQFVVSNDEHATLVSRETPPPDWIQPGVIVRIEVESPGGEVTAAPLRNAPAPLSSPEPRTLSSNDLGEMRRALIRILNKIEGTTAASVAEGLAARISRLARAERVPREVVPWMKTVTEMRNQAEYQERVLTLVESEAVAAAWRAITAWAGKNAY